MGWRVLCEAGILEPKRTPLNITAVVLAGGLGTRLRPITLNIPKPLVRINEKPFLDYLLQKISSMGIRDVVLLTGYKHEMIEKYCRKGQKWGIRIKYSREPSPLGTGGAILKARKLIKNTALVLNGDSYFQLNLQGFLSSHQKNNSLATIFAMHGSLSDRGAIISSKNGQVLSFLEKQKGGFGLFNTGAYLIEPSALSFLAKKIHSRKFSMEKDGFPQLVAKKCMYAYKGKGKFLDIGTFAALAGAHKILLPKSQKKEAKIGAIFLDRDGVINKNRENYITHPDEFEFENGAIEGLKALSRLPLPLLIVTNQSIIGRKLASRKTLSKIHDKMLGVLVHNGIKITGILFCPHMPHKNCICRKPKTGMLLAAQKKFRIDLKKSFVIGDSSGDMLMGNNAGCTTILMATGYGGKDAKHPGKADYNAKNLSQAAKIVKELL
ncbi:Bifunctional protein GlmU [Candidatus Anstonella stagnisolia]|nr:Bifunctional protein GlmU [Candidatus Anstonella stagnisolia]